MLPVSGLLGNENRNSRYLFVQEVVMADGVELEMRQGVERELIPAREALPGEAALPAALPAFDYSGMPEEVAEVQRARADRIFGLARRGLEIQAAIGRELMQAQAELEHGQFLSWVEGALGLTTPTAYRHINVAKNARPEDLPLLRTLPAEVVHKLLASKTDETVRASVVERLRRQEPVRGDEVLKEIRTAAEATKAKAAEDKEAARSAGLTPEALAKEKIRAGARRRSAERRERKDAEQSRTAERERREQDEAAAAGAKILMDALGVDRAARFADQFALRASDVMSALGDLTGLARAEEQPVVTVPVGHIERAWRLASYRVSPDDLERAKQIAADIGFDGAAPIATLARDARLTNRFKLLSDPLVYLALTEVLQRDEIEARIVPPLPPLKLEPEGGAKPKEAKLRDAEAKPKKAQKAPFADEHTQAADA